MKKLIGILILCLLLLSLVVPFTSAFFYQNHIKFTLTGFEEVQSPITQLCKPHLKEFIDGNLAADVPVLHYFDSKVASYIGTHTLGAGLQACLNKADDDGQRCFCYGQGLHWTAQDRFSHTNANGIQGLVPKYLSKYGSFNFIGHMSVERDFEKKSIEMYTKANDPIITSGALTQYDDTALDSLFDVNGGSTKYLELLSDSAGIDLTNDAKIFRNGYQGEGFYSTVYKDKIGLPLWFWAVCVVLIVLGLILIVLALKFGKTRWKWFIFIEGVILLVLGLIIFFSIFTGQSWELTTVFIEIPPKFGYLSVSNADIVYYDQVVQQATNEYLKTGVAPITDGSGLSYQENTGVWVKGALIEAQKFGVYIIFPVILLLLLISNALVIVRSFRKKITKLNIFGKIGVTFVTLFVAFAGIITFYMLLALFF